VYKLIVALGALALTVGIPQDASAVSQKVKDACRGDYYAYCSQHEVGSQGLRDCMTEAFDKLSDPCVAAILDSELQRDNAHPHKRPQHAHRSHRRDNWVAHVKHGTRVAKRFMARVGSRARHFLR
jgi:hypothetical protein